VAYRFVADHRSAFGRMLSRRARDRADEQLRRRAAHTPRSMSAGAGMLDALAEMADRAVAALPLVRDDAGAQRTALLHTAHRPWPLPDTPWMLAQTWRDLVFAHWAVDPADLRPLIPVELPLDTFEANAWIGITPFVVTGFRLRGMPPLPVVSSFPELNVRTYVTVGGKPGIYFLSLDADSHLAVAGARRSHRLPYFRARMSVQREGATVRYESERVSGDGPAASFEATYRSRGEAFSAAPGSLDHWLTERYCAYTLDEERRVLRADIHHRPWQLRGAEAQIRQNTMTRPFGIALSGAPLLHMSLRQDSLLWGLCPAEVA
jgi:uncharacterized protein YqjF (DUF2071 family)